MTELNNARNITGSGVSNRDEHLFFLESLDRTDRALRGAENLDQMMADVLDTVLAIFGSDRAWLLFPCDPRAPFWSVPMERTKKGYPGALSGGVDIPMIPEAKAVFEAALESNRPVAYDNHSGRPVPPQTAKQFNILSQITVAIYPKIGSPWLLGTHQCSHARIWKAEEQRLFHEIGRRIADGLNTLLLLQDLRASEKKYRAVVNNSPDLIYRADTNGLITFVSESIFSLSGYTMEEAIGMKMARDLYVDPEERALFLDKIMKHGSVENFEAQLRHKNGSVWWASTNARLLKDAHGKILGVEGTTRNITDKKLAEKALSQSEAYLRTLIHTIPDLVWLKDTQGIYRFCNSRFERFFGAQESKIIGKTDYDFVSRELADFFRKHDKLAMAKGRPSINEEEVTFADDGHPEILETIKTPMYTDTGQLIGVLGIARDITERRQAEKNRKLLESQLRQAHKMEAIGTISGGIAHDFNNILGIIIGNVEMALEDIPEWNPACSNLEEIKRAGLRASDVVKQLLNFSRKTEKKKTIITIEPIIRESINLLRASIPTLIDIQLDMADGLGAIKADPTQIHQVLINLCTNAAHAMEQKGGILKIGVAEIQLDNMAASRFQEIEAGRYIQLTISDSGHGIEPAIQAKIFDPYFTTKEVGKGTGMGLAVVHGIVINHSGAISVCSEPGQGTTFKVLFPVAGGKASMVEAPSQAKPRGNETILFVDDEEALTAIGRDILTKLGYRVETKTDPLEALELLRSDPSRFDLIITDMTMPRMTGDQLVEAVSKVCPATPVILCTGYSSKIDASHAAKIGAHSYLEKPFRIAVLARTVRKVLDGTAVVNRPPGKHPATLD